MNIDLRTINLLRMKTLTIAILLAGLSGYLTRAAFTLDGSTAILSGVSAFVIWVLTCLNAFETLSWHRQYCRVRDHLRDATDVNERCLDCGVRRGNAKYYFCTDSRDSLGLSMYRNADGRKRRLGEHNWPPPTRVTLKKD